jgi:anti-sigma B factor antagonist
MKPNVAAHIENDTNYLRISGDLEMFSISELKRKLYNLTYTDSFNHIELDLSNVTYMDSMGLATLVGFIKRMRDMGRIIELVCVREDIIAIIKLAGLYDFIFGKNKQ